MIVRHFRILIQVHEMVNKGENSFSITKKLKQHPFVIQKTSAQSKNFNQKKLEEIYRNMLETDKNLKTGVIKYYGKDNKQVTDSATIDQFPLNFSGGEAGEISQKKKN